MYNSVSFGVEWGIWIGFSALFSKCFHKCLICDCKFVLFPCVFVLHLCLLSIFRLYPPVYIQLRSSLILWPGAKTNPKHTHTHTPATNKTSHQCPDCQCFMLDFVSSLFSDESKHSCG